MGFNIKDYTLVKDRLIAFREEFPLSSITTELLSVSNIVDSPTGDYANEYVVKATVIPNPLQEPEVVYTGLAAERDNTGFVNKSSAIENCETSAVGRALAMLGIGIDTSIASSNEVQDAIAKQEEMVNNPHVQKLSKKLDAPVENIMDKAVSYIKSQTDKKKAFTAITKKYGEQLTEKQVAGLKKFVR